MKPQTAPAPMPPAPRPPGRSRPRSRRATTTVVERHNRSDRQIDAAGDDHHRHAERRRADDRGLPGDELEVVAAEELRADEEAEDDRDKGETDERAGGFEQRRGVSRSLGIAAPVGFEHQAVLGELGDRARRAEPSAAHDGDAIAQAEELGQVAADHQHGLRGGPSSSRRRQTSASMSRRSAPCSRRRCRASARRAGARRRRGGAAARWPPSAGCRPRARRPAGAGCEQRMPSRSIQRVAAAILRARQNQRPGPSPLQPRQRHVVGDGQGRAASPSSLRSSLTKPQPPRQRSSGVAASAMLRLLSLLSSSDVPRRTRPVRTGSSPKSRAQQPRAAGAEQPRDAEHLAAVEREGGGARTEVTHLENRRSAPPRRPRVERFDRPADHEANDRGRREASGRRRRPRSCRRAATTKRSATSFTSSMKCEM